MRVYIDVRDCSRCNVMKRSAHTLYLCIIKNDFIMSTKYVLFYVVKSINILYIYFRIIIGVQRAYNSSPYDWQRKSFKFVNRERVQMCNFRRPMQ